MVLDGRCCTLALAVLVAAACSTAPSSEASTCACLPGDTCVAGRCVAGGGTADGGTGGAGTGGATGGASLDGGVDGGSAAGGGLGTLACVLPPPAPSAAPPVQVVALGPRPVGSTVTFSVPAGTASVTLVEQAISARGSVALAGGTVLRNGAVPLRVTDARGRTIYDDLVQPAVDPTAQLLYAGAPGAVVGSLVLPNSSVGLDLVAAGLAAGPWSAVVSDYAYECSIATGCTADSASAAGVYDVTVILKPGSGAAVIPTAGRVDVTFHLTPGHVQPPLSAATAASDVDVQRMVRTLGALLAGAGVALGTLSYVDVAAAMADRVANGVDLDDGSACGELAQLLASGTGGRQVNVFLVPDFTASDVPPDGALAGVDGTIPGPATIAPTVASGAAVRTVDLRHNTGTAACRGGFDLACGADRTALVAAHELGHYFGLFHVTEEEGSTFDPLSDTAACPCTSCAATASQCGAATSPYPMRVSDCTRSSTCGGGDNLMFWIIDTGSTGQLSAQQGRVIRASAAVY